MTGYRDVEDVVKSVTEIAAKVTGVPVIHSPSSSAGEKIIYRYTPGSYDGEWDTVTVTMRFISRNIGDAMERAKCVGFALLSDEGEQSLSVNGSPSFVVRKHSGGSGYIGKTGHYFVLAAFEVRRHIPAELL